MAAVGVGVCFYDSLDERGLFGGQRRRQQWSLAGFDGLGRQRLKLLIQRRRELRLRVVLADRRREALVTERVTSGEEPAVMRFDSAGGDHHRAAHAVKDGFGFHERRDGFFAVDGLDLFVGEFRDGPFAFRCHGCLLWVLGVARCLRAWENSGMSDETTIRMNDTPSDDVPAVRSGPEVVAITGIAKRRVRLTNWDTGEDLGVHEVDFPKFERGS